MILAMMTKACQIMPGRSATDHYFATPTHARGLTFTHVKSMKSTHFIIIGSSFSGREILHLLARL
jgi:hypothetical protein